MGSKGMYRLDLDLDLYTRSLGLVISAHGLSYHCMLMTLNTPPN
uniref:Uncharacterized protein n=1 Tax=Anguilla anguilla TaxID=7936 RepID=A0A0E9QI76_ANGAN